jgi:hypothetical protein
MGKGSKKSNANGAAGGRFKANPRGFEYKGAKSLDEDRGHSTQRRGSVNSAMSTQESTCWTVIAAAAGCAAQRAALAQRYQPVIRALAARWQIEAATLHHEYAKTRQEFKASLAEVVAFYYPGSPAEVERECANLLSLLG